MVQKNRRFALTFLYVILTLVSLVFVVFVVFVARWGFLVCCFRFRLQVVERACFVIGNQVYPHFAEVERAYRCRGDDEPLEKVRMDAYVVCQNQPDDIGVGDSDNERAFVVLRAQRFERSNSAALHFAERFATRKARGARVELNPCPEGVLFEFFEFSARPFAVAHFADALHNRYTERVGGGNRLGSFHCSLQRAAVDSRNGHLGEALR